MFEIEKDLLKKGHRYVIGIDEVGRGPLAGDVVSAAVCIDLNNLIDGVKDSKALTDKKRKEMATKIKDEALGIAISKASPELIDSINIKQATILTMEKALNKLLKEMEEKGVTVDVALVDSEVINSPVKSISIDKGDDKCNSIGAASIIAKVYRDSLAQEWHKEYPNYSFNTNKGYGSQAHRNAIVRYGPTPIHRKTFLKNLPMWRENSYTKGRLGETMAVEMLQEKGYQVIEQNYEVPSGEIDIIAIKDDIIVFTEVKLRRNSDYGYGHEHVSDRQKSRIRTTATIYRRDNELLDYQPRFDIVEIYTEDNSKVHYENAF